MHEAVLLYRLPLILIFITEKSICKMLRFKKEKRPGKDNLGLRNFLIHSSLQSG